MEIGGRMPLSDDSSWERRCGEHDARLSGVEDSVKTLFARDAEAQNRYVKIMERLTSVETKLVFFTAIAAAAGSLLPSIVSAVLK